VSEAAGALTLYTRQPPALVAARRYLEAQAPAIERRLAPFRGLTAERFTALVITEMVRTPTLQECMATEKGQTSLQLAVMELAQYGLQPGGLGHGYVVPFYKNKDRYMHATAIFGWKGLVQLALRSPLVRSIDIEEVYPEDDFDYVKGTRPHIHHVPRYEGPPDPDRLAYVYAVCHTKHGGHKFIVLSKAQVEFYRRKSKQPDGEAWKNNWVAMARKTSARRGFPLWPVEDEFRTAAVQEEEREESIAEEGVLEGEVLPPEPPRIVAGRDRRRRPADPPAPPGSAAAPEPPPPDVPSEPAAPPPATAMPLPQRIAMACRRAGIDRARLLRALTDEEHASALSEEEAHQVLDTIAAIERGEMRFAQVEGEWRVVAVAGDAS
jgi:recombination protein RecT